MANLSLKKSLAILVRQRDTHDSQSSIDMSVSTSPTGSDSVVRLPASTPSSLQEPQPIYPGWQYVQTTPTLNTSFVNGYQLIDGMGRRCPATPPRSAQSLDIDDGHATETPATPRVVWPNICDPEYTFKTPPGSGSLNEIIWEPAFPLTPRPTPCRKRVSSPPFAPRPAKRRKLSTERVDEDFRSKLYRGGDCLELARDCAFGNAGHPTSSPVGTAGYPAVKLESPHENLMRLGRILGQLTTCSSADGQVETTINDEDLSGPKRDQVERSHEPRYTLRIECFSEEEIEEHLAQLVRAYRAFHLVPDEAEPPRPRDADVADKNRRFFQAIFEHQLTSAESEGFLLQNEEEDVLDVFSTWTRENLNRIPSELREDRFEDLSERFERLITLPVAALIQGIHLSVKTRDGSLFMVDLPARGLSDAVEWRLGDFDDGFCEIA